MSYVKIFRIFSPIMPQYLWQKSHKIFQRSNDYIYIFHLTSPLLCIKGNWNASTNAQEHFCMYKLSSLKVEILICLVTPKYKCHDCITDTYTIDKNPACMGKLFSRGCPPWPGGWGACHLEKFPVGTFFSGEYEKIFFTCKYVVVIMWAFDPALGECNLKTPTSAYIASIDVSCSIFGCSYHLSHPCAICKKIGPKYVKSFVIFFVTFFHFMFIDINPSAVKLFLGADLPLVRELEGFLPPGEISSGGFFCWT